MIPNFHDLIVIEWRYEFINGSIQKKTAWKLFCTKCSHTFRNYQNENNAKDVKSFDLASPRCRVSSNRYAVTKEASE